ncbi:putative membrane protein [Thioploca ingrica]|uniref:Putative membrane protein n=1 Tax=Thioploca ingrica TaxID=40754 RepID=A0A090ABK9_9GAMM|nr:putative membrane protein [Thioploca ingrica]
MICLQKPESVFILFGFIFGVLVILITPPFQVPDEHSHFFRALEVSQGDLIPTVNGNVAGGLIPVNAIATGGELAGYLAFNPQSKQSFEKLAYFFKLPPEPLKKQFAKSTAYPPVPYLPPLIGISVGKLFHLSWLKTMYLGRVTSLFVWLLCLYLTIKVIPTSKWLVVVLALSPMTIFQAASLSADSLTIALSFLFIAIFLKLALEENIKFTPLVITLLIIIAILISLCKQAYISLIFLFFLIPIKKLGLKRYGLFFSLMFLFTVSSLVFWYHLAREAYATFPFQHFKLTTSYHEQLSFILTHPLQYLVVLFNTIKLYGVQLIEGFIGKLGWLDTSLPRWLLFLHAAMLIFYALTDSKPGVTISLFQKIIIFTVWLGSIILIFTLLYLTIAPIGHPVVETLQGRYFIPIGILFFLLFYNNYFQLKQETLLFITIGYIPLLLTTMLAALINRYYVQLF